MYRRQVTYQNNIHKHVLYIKALVVFHRCWIAYLSRYGGLYILFCKQIHHTIMTSSHVEFGSNRPEIIITMSFIQIYLIYSTSLNFPLAGCHSNFLIQLCKMIKVRGPFVQTLCIESDSYMDAI